MARAPAAAGTTKGPAPLPATLHAPDFLRLEKTELQALLNKLRSPLALHTYMLLLTQMRYTDGEFLGGYARLIELMTPPAPERGKRMPAPSMWDVRKAVADLIALGLVTRGEKNEEQGQLRLFMAPRGKPKAAPIRPATAAKTTYKQAPVGAKNPAGAFARLEH